MKRASLAPGESLRSEPKKIKTIGTTIKRTKTANGITNKALASIPRSFETVLPEDVFPRAEPRVGLRNRSDSRVHHRLRIPGFFPLARRTSLS